MANKITAQQAAEEAGFDSINDCLEAVIFGTEHCPALCSEGCVTEVDGTCQHGFPSLALATGVI